MRGKNLEEALQYYREISNRSAKRRGYVLRKAEYWLRRTRPDLLESYWKQAYRKFPNPSGRKRLPAA